MERGAKRSFTGKYVDKIIEKVKTKEHSKQIFAELSH